MKLTDKQKRFCDEYLIDLNATQAAIRAGYSKKTAFIIANENLKKPYIRGYIDERLKQLEDKRIAKADEVLKYLTSVFLNRVNLSIEIRICSFVIGLTFEFFNVTYKIFYKIKGNKLRSWRFKHCYNFVFWKW